MNRVYLGPTIKRGTFMYRSTKVGDFVIGKDAIKELDAHLHEFRMPIAPTRAFDPHGTITRALKKIRNYNLPPTK